MSIAPIRVLVVHSSAELYGSDRSLLDFVQHRDPSMQITVALPTAGELVTALEAAGATVVIGDVCKVQRGMLSPFGFAHLALSVWRAWRFLGSVHRRVGFDLVYSNTVAVLGGAICARLWRVPHVWHVREILLGSRIVTGSFQRLVARSSVTVVSNSAHTQDWIRAKGSHANYQVVWNGFDVPVVSANGAAKRERLGASEDDVLFVLVGRINAWKGQRLLVQAFAKLHSSCPVPVRLAIVGSPPPGQEHYESELQDCIAQSGCADKITLLPYRADIAAIWLAADVVVVPSTDPEPFGRVAIEAMGYGRPIIAAAHGGLVEIVVDGETGCLVEPRSADALAAAMDTLARDPAMRKKMGDTGRFRQLAMFTVGSYANRMNAIIRAAVADKTVLFVHQSAEMYGSDKVLLALATGVVGRGFHPIVLLPGSGPLLTALQAGGIDTHILPIAKLDRATLSAKGVLALPLQLVASMRAIRRIARTRRIDLVYTNTLAVLGSAVWAKLHGVPHLWHVHEILKSPAVVRRGLPFFLRLMADKAVCNSQVTRQWVLAEQPALADRTSVVWNGLAPRPPAKLAAAAALRARLGVQDGQLLVTLVGRINRWKGQALLVRAATLLWERGFTDVHYLIVGSAVEGQAPQLHALEDKIAASKAASNIHIKPFTDDVWAVWDACDIAVVPSTEPEPFGLVAIEAMASGKPVVVAAHGGLLDIVEHEVSGLHFKPGDAGEFASQLARLIESPSLRSELGATGCARQQSLFSLREQLDSMVTLMQEMTRTKRRPQTRGHRDAQEQ
jgi:glycosyltransferase involved in cell wall biosynthesis